jgi:small conductance mechanosensitive channel
MGEKISEAISKVYFKILGWIEQVILLLPNLLVAALIFVVFYLVGRQARKLLARPMGKISHSPALVDLVVNLVFILFTAVGLFIGLSVLQLDKAVTSLLAGAGIVGLALGFAFQDIAANFVAGILMAIKKPLDINDVIETNGHFGTVTHINLRSTIIRTTQGQHVIIPNKEIYNNPIINYSAEGKRRVDLKCGISYGDDLQKVKNVVLKAIRSIDYIDHEPAVSFFYTEFADSSINFTVRYWIDFKKQPDYLQAMSDGIMRIKEAFDQNDIMIPFPIRTLDFGIKGGEKLSEHLTVLGQEVRENDK